MTVQVTDRSTSQLTVYEITAVQGDVWQLSLSTDTLWDQVMSIAIFVEGSTNFDRSAGQRGPFYTPNAVRKAGDCSLDFAVPMMPAGRFSYTVTTPTFRYYCLVDPKNRALGGSAVRLANGQTYTPLIGRRLFVAIGSVSVAAQTFSEPSVVDIQTSGQVVTATTDGTLLIDIALLS